MVSIMELQLLSGSKNRNALPMDKPKWNPRGGNPKVELCRNFANTGQCNYGEHCKFKHVHRAGPPRGATPGYQAGRQAQMPAQHPAPATQPFHGN